MNILIFSDSHGKGDNIKEALMRQINEPDAVIFLGDGLRDISYLELGEIPVYCVKGNCDGIGASMLGAPDEQLLILGSKRIFIAHGHGYHVKSLLSPIITRANELEADIVMFGHTHVMYERRLDIENEYGIALKKPLVVFNPGSIGGYPYSFGCIEITPRGDIIASHGALR